MFELGEHLLDRIEVGTMGRQEDEMCAFGANGMAGCFAFLAAEIVGDHNFALAPPVPSSGLRLILDDSAPDDAGASKSTASSMSILHQNYLKDSGYVSV